MNQQNESISGVTVVASSSALGTIESAFTDESGCYQVYTGPGVYKVTFYWADLTEVVEGVTTRVGEATEIDARF
jgi:hypothetical protein